MDLERISFGKVNTHLRSLLADIEAALGRGPGEVRRALRRANDDPVFRMVATGRFHQPTRSGGLRLGGLVEKIRRQADPHGDDLRPFLEAVERYTLNSPSTWDENSYFIVPVVAGEERQPGLVYLHAVPLEGNPRAPRGRLSIDDLTRDPRLLSAAQDYFGELAAVLVETLYFVQSYQLEFYESLTQYSYRLHFGSRIDEGKSIGAAALAMFGIAYLQAWLGEQFRQAVAPQCGTVLTGEVSRDGRVLPVEHLREKIECAVEEFGDGLKVIVPRGESLPERLERRIDPANIYYVGNAEELLAAALSSGGNDRGLGQARAALFRRLYPAQKDKLSKFIKAGIDPHIHDLIAQGSPDWATPRRHAGGAYVVSNAWHDRLDVKLALEPSALQADEDGGARRELVQVVLDGSEVMGEHWAADQATRICRMTSVLYEIKSRIDPERQELICGFLSHRTFFPVRLDARAEELESFLQQTRESQRLAHRGAFFRPVYEASLAHHHDRLKRAYVISDRVPPDLEDLQDLNLSSLTWLRLFDAEPWEQEAGPEPQATLFRDVKRLDAAQLSRYFQRERGTIGDVWVDFGKELPVEWEPPTGVLLLEGESLVLRFSEVNELKCFIRVRLANQHPHEIKIRGQVCGDGGGGDVSPPGDGNSFSFIEHPTQSTLKPLGHVRAGRLTEEEFAAWRKFETREWVCPGCGRTDPHLLDLPEAKAEERPVFPSLRHLSGGYLLLFSDSPDWHFFGNGCQVAGTAFVVIDGRLHWSQARGRVEEVPYENEFYCLRDEGRSFYLCHTT